MNMSKSEKSPYFRHVFAKYAIGVHIFAQGGHGHVKSSDKNTVFSSPASTYIMVQLSLEKRVKMLKKMRSFLF